MFISMYPGTESATEDSVRHGHILRYRLKPKTQHFKLSYAFPVSVLYSSFLQITFMSAGNVSPSWPEESFNLCLTCQCCSFPKLGSQLSPLWFMEIGKVSEFALEHSNMSNPERDQRQLHGKFFNMSFAIKKLLESFHAKVISTFICASALSLCGRSCSWTNRTSSESEFVATSELLHLSITRPIGGYSSHGFSRYHGGALQLQLG